MHPPSHYICIYIYIYIYICIDVISLSLYIYIYVYVLSSSRKPSGHLFMVSVVDIIYRFCFYVFRRFSFYGFRRRRKRVYGFSRRIFEGFCRRRRIHNFRKYRVIPRFGVFRTGFRRCFCFYGFRRGRKTLFYGFRRCLFNGFRRGKECFVWFPSFFFVWFPAATGPRLSLRWKPFLKKEHKDVSVTK